MYFVYIIRCDDNSLYTGITTDLNKRFSQHKTKTRPAAKYTKSRQAVSVEAIWSAPDRSAAQKLEYQIKQISKARKEELIKNHSLVFFADKIDITQYENLDVKTHFKASF